MASARGGRPPPREDSERPQQEQGPGAGAEDLLTRVEAIRHLGISSTNFYKRQREGLFKPIQRDGRTYYDRAELDEAALDSDQDKPLQQLVTALGSALQSAQRHAEQIFTLNRDASQQLLKTLADENAALRAREEAYEKRWLETMALLESLAKEQHDRELERSRVEASEKRKEALWDTLLELAPPLAEQVLGTHQIGKFLRELDRNQLQFFLDTTEGSFLNPTQRELLREALAKFDLTKGKASGRKQKVDAGTTAEGREPSNSSGGPPS